MMTWLRRAAGTWLCLTLVAGLLLDDASAYVARLDDDDYEYEIDDADDGGFIADDDWDDDDVAYVAGDDWDDDWDDDGDEIVVWPTDADDDGWEPVYAPEPALVPPPPQPAGLLLDDDDACVIIDDDGDAATDGYCAMQAIVRTQPAADIGQLTDDYDLDVIADITGQPVYLLSLPPGNDEVQTVATLATDSRVAWAELNRVDQAPEGRPQRFFLRGQAPVPGTMTQAYAPQLIGISAAGICGTGTGVRIAVIDSGVDPSHPAFQNTDLRHAWNAFSDQDGLGNVDDIGNDEDDDLDGLIDEMTGHGTHVTGIIAQLTPQATIVPIKALDSDGMGQAFYLARALAYAADRDAQVINLSLGSTANARVVQEAVDGALAVGAFFAVAAGNNGGPAPIEYPGAQAGVFTVAATDRQDARAEFSSHHDGVSLSAPGVDIVSPFPLDQPPGDQLGSDYALWSGTSMATPFVSGAAALLLAQDASRSAGDVAARLRTTADPLSGTASGMGSGRLDAGAALGCGAGEPGENPPPTVTPPPGGEQVTNNPGIDQNKDKKKKKKGKGKNRKKRRG